jgi:uncharacterized protein YecE (DUF72 family)
MGSTINPIGGIRLGTSAFTAAGWPGSFYPEGMKPADYLTYYSTKFGTVELDSTFYRTPALSVVRGWNAKTPRGFLFAAKIPQVITHEKMLADCESDLNHFLKTMDALEEKLGPLLFQFGYFNQKAFKSAADFIARLDPFLKKLPKAYRFAVEIRNKNWLDAQFADVLRKHDVALALIDQVWMPRIDAVAARLDPVTTDFTYVRWLGDRKGIEEQTKTWDKTIVNRKPDLEIWVKELRKIKARKINILAFANNHYAGNGPATVELFRSLWEK